ncbi:hypothetical protein MetMK1DRAFT_00006270 [Metallosphaera yellowstonensis MK1]|jgi:hypothetical protein|uniref:Uncharacterized protein n=1 Tax=Metallosphaera yellowstonensis MK1 TaxID=671065 RepID=H2C1K4_9CREN|nr:hypothetical protein [Metallosphaera yellowstonensis]EHP70125.1 hypothetical protein MetMK1DRAFT_00006270 [Metallosphaera yellowstonensis MK1]
MVEPFYFKSYDRVVGVARDERELETEIMRIGSQDPACVNYHLREGHIVSWLNYVGNRTLAEMLKGVSDYREALARMRDYFVMTGEKAKSKDVPPNLGRRETTDSRGRTRKSNANRRPR